MHFSQVLALLVLLFPYIVSGNFTVHFDDSKSPTTFSFSWFLEGDQKVLVANNTVVVRAQEVPIEQQLPSKEKKSVDIKIANSTSPHLLLKEDDAHRFLINSGKLIDGIAKADRGVGVCTDLKDEAYMLITGDKNYAVLVFEPPRGQPLWEYTCGEHMSYPMGALLFTMLLSTVQQRSDIGMFHGNIHPKNIYWQTTDSKNGKAILSNFESAFYGDSPKSGPADLLYSALAMTDTECNPCLETETESVVYCVIYLTTGFLPWQKTISDYLALIDKKYTTPEMEEQRMVDEQKKLKFIDDIKTSKGCFQFSKYKEYDEMEKELKRTLMVTLRKCSTGKSPTNDEIQHSIASYAEANKNTMRLSRKSSLSIFLNGVLNKSITD